MIVRMLFSLAMLLYIRPVISLAQDTSASTATQYRPWAYWWWMGSAVDSINVQRQLLAFSNAGFGGVHVIPIYGVKGYESHFKPFLGEAWMNILDYTTSQAEQLGMGVDLSMGTGWPFGGPHISPKDAAKKFVRRGNQFLAVATGQQVKRAGPGGEGPVIDYFDSASVVRYFRPFEKLLNIQVPVRSLYHDSFEAYGANWSTHFAEQFKRRRGYALADKFAAFSDTVSSEGVYVRMDYQQTLSELLHDRFALLWTQWSRAKGYRTRYQAHGSPGNILDLYALADIPETESFGTSRFTIPGLRVDDHYEVDRFGTPDVLAMKFASSAAHLTGKKLVSAETGTWLADHFKVALSQVKPQIDELFTAGINHIFYHGITYSPAEEGFPGWLFYASTNFGPQSHVWPYMAQLNGWVTRCQERLQNTAPDNDILLYFPMHDVWSKTRASDNPVQLLDVHHTEKWLRDSPFGATARQLMDAGHTFDYVSDSLLMNLTARRGKVMSNKQAYQVIVVPAVDFMPIRTLRKLDELSRSGASILFVGHVPTSPAGLRASRNAFVAAGRAAGNEGRVINSDRLIQQIERLGARKEGFTAEGISFIRKRSPQGVSYFVANLSNHFTADWIRVSESAKAFQLYDPLINKTRSLLSRRQQSGALIYLELQPGESAFILPGSGTEPPHQKEWSSLPLNGNWGFSFENGLPAIKQTKALAALDSWTTFADSAQYFYGTGRYQLNFDSKPDVVAAQDIVLDLGDVREVADVRLNGQSLGTAWCIPFRLRVPLGLLKENNSLEVTVSNLSANYMRLYDRIHPEWKKFYDINIVDIQYKPYTAENAAVMPSGLLGPVTLRYR